MCRSRRGFITCLKGVSFRMKQFFSRTYNIFEKFETNFQCAVLSIWNLLPRSYNINDFDNWSCVELSRRKISVAKNIKTLKSSQSGRFRNRKKLRYRSCVLTEEKTSLENDRVSSVYIMLHCDVFSETAASIYFWGLRHETMYYTFPIPTNRLKFCPDVLRVEWQLLLPLTQ